MTGDNVLSEILAYYKYKVDKNLCTPEEMASAEKFINTLVHEIHHLASVIADGLGVDLLGETPAYVAGDAAMALAHTLCDLGCSHCHSSSSSSS